ncbi:MAG: DUF6390 family protein [Actinomycetota bacterium]|nr:DUF6390 family protein [Actinomycetota bacterium]
MTTGAALFSRFAFPPNALGYCGPPDSELTHGLLNVDAASELARVVKQFEGAWPYLELIAGVSAKDPLDFEVVEAYWVGNQLLDSVDPLVWGNSIDDQFRGRAGSRWSTLSDGIVDGRPNHAFHVFCVYPWVGLLRTGFADHALEVIDRCRIRWGQVVSVAGDSVEVEGSSLLWDGREILMGPNRREVVRRSVDVPVPSVGQAVAMHWDYMCASLQPRQLANLRLQSARHIKLANRLDRRLEKVFSSS